MTTRRWSSTPRGFDRPGAARAASGDALRTVQIIVRDRATDHLTPCRINVVGPDGDFYQPGPEPISPYSLTGQWPETGKGKPAGQGPVSVSRPLLLHDGRNRGRRSGRAGPSRSLERIRISAGRTERHGSRPGETVAGLARARASHADGGDRLLFAAILTCIFRVRMMPMIKRSSTCSKPRTSGLARSWPTTSRPGPYTGAHGNDGFTPASGPGSTPR